MTASSRRVLQIRLVVEADDYEDAVRFYRDVLGAAEELQLHGDGGASVALRRKRDSAAGQYDCGP